MKDDARNIDNTKIDDKTNPVRILSANDILAVEDLNIVPVLVPEWGGTVYVKAMTATQREKYIESMRRARTSDDGKTTIVETILRYGSAKLAALTLCNAQGELLFDRSPETIEKLGQKSAKAMERVVDAAAKLNNLDTDEDKKKEKEKDSEKAKNGLADQPDDASGLSID